VFLSLEQAIEQDNIVRVIAIFLDHIDLKHVGFIDDLQQTGGRHYLA